MNEQDIWLVFDTSIKVITGVVLTFGCLWAARMWRDRSQADPHSAQRRRLSLLEEISSDVGRVNHVFAKYSALVIESTRFGKRWPPARKQELERINAELVHEFSKLADSEAKLLMLGEKNDGKKRCVCTAPRSPYSENRCISVVKISASRRLPNSRPVS